jgi:hypothetical protein
VGAEGFHGRRHRYGHLNSAIKVVVDVFRKYTLLLEGRQPAFPREDFDVSEDFAKIWPRSLRVST